MRGGPSFPVVPYLLFHDRLNLLWVDLCISVHDLDAATIASTAAAATAATDTAAATAATTTTTTTDSLDLGHTPRDVCMLAHKIRKRRRLIHQQAEDRKSRSRGESAPHPRLRRGSVPDRLELVNDASARHMHPGGHLSLRASSVALGCRVLLRPGLSPASLEGIVRGQGRAGEWRVPRGEGRPSG